MAYIGKESALPESVFVLWCPTCFRSEAYVREPKEPYYDHYAQIGGKRRKCRGPLRKVRYDQNGDGDQR